MGLYGNIMMIDKSRCNAKNVTMIDKNCIFCSKRADTREHIIPRCFLNKPYPNNLPTLPSCRKCNNSFSLDEEYVMYLIDYLKSIEVNDGEFTRPKAEKAFEYNGKLEDRMIKSLEELDDGICFNVETDRVERIAKKISMCLLVYKFDKTIKLDQMIIHYNFASRLTTEGLQHIQHELSNEFQPGEFSFKIYNNREVLFSISNFFFVYAKVT